MLNSTNTKKRWRIARKTKRNRNLFNYVKFDMQLYLLELRPWWCLISSLFMSQDETHVSSYSAVGFCRDLKSSVWKATINWDWAFLAALDTEQCLLNIPSTGGWKFPLKCGLIRTFFPARPLGKLEGRLPDNWPGNGNGSILTSGSFLSGRFCRFAICGIAGLNLEIIHNMMIIIQKYFAQACCMG